MTRDDRPEPQRFSSQPELSPDLVIGRNISTARQLADLTQSALGEILGVTHQQIHKYENGINRVRAGDLVMIAAATGKDIDYFYWGLPARDQDCHPAFATAEDVVLARRIHALPELARSSVMSIILAIETGNQEHVA